MTDIPSKKDKKYPPPLSIRFTFEERAELDELSEGMPVGRFIRECTFRFLKIGKTPKSLPVQDAKLLAKVLGLLGKSRISSNINQLAKAANSGSLPVNDDVQKALMEACQAIMFIRDTLIEALGLKSKREKVDKRNDP